ncbi:MAG: preprotein translocase subunit SecF [Parcubacteria group bacterium Gr01-1014_48]|nr:MAG: preprotein translocase subunit SecF [Parcubacteria group bacterium Greene0416_14]TSC72053.1 MAG: preprotein translocase subunit SecF [Parcubacteria group bacterium Gr01-1014_48]TSC99826.1 MAG: preprotein translocase subunit SecF [Parcubacteria group bacterium Greene1014_15]TSD07155.1 MAG: preprotein translocase subunit SecF [Parcubacteria group bacterium Greene0714_4]
MFVIRHKTAFILISTAVALLSLLAIIVFRLPIGVDFTGGSIIEVRYIDGRPAAEEITPRLDTLSLGSYRLQGSGDDRYIIRTKMLSETQRLPVIDALSLGDAKNVVEERFNSIGPVVGGELKRKAFAAMIVVILAIILFIAFAFRKVGKPVSSWKYGMVAVLTLAHDVLVPTGVFALLGRTSAVEIDILFVTAFLAILGYSVNDTIVVFDRIRENLKLNEEYRKKEDFDVTVGNSLTQTYARSFNTSFTMIIVLAALYAFGSDSVRYFSLALLIGTIAGTYSSIFLASPLLVYIQEKSKVKL